MEESERTVGEEMIALDEEQEKRVGLFVTIGKRDEIARVVEGEGLLTTKKRARSSQSEESDR
jgi:hypothetical protein